MHQKNYRPSSTSRENALSCLRGNKSVERLDHLEKKLRIIQIVEPSSDIRFTLDPVAEYFAALHLVRECGSDPEKWQQYFINRVNQIGTVNIQGFLQAVYDCCLSEKVNLEVPDTITERLLEWLPLSS